MFIELVSLVLIVVLANNIFSNEKFTPIYPPKSQNLIYPEPTADDPFMNNYDPVLKVTDPYYTKSMYNLQENLAANDKTMTDPEMFYHKRFTRNFNTEPSDDMEAFREMIDIKYDDSVVLNDHDFKRRGGL
jgi:hypothetical protein